MNWETEVEEALKILGYSYQKNLRQFNNRKSAMHSGSDFVVEGNLSYDIEYGMLITEIKILQSGIVIPKACACKRLSIAPTIKDSFMLMVQETQEELLKIAKEVAFTVTEVSKIHYQLEEVIISMQSLQREIAEPAKRDVDYIRQMVQDKMIASKNHIEIQALATLQTELNIMKA